MRGYLIICRMFFCLRKFAVSVSVSIACIFIIPTEAFALKKCVGNYYHNCFAKTTDESGGVYEGEVWNGNRHGVGKNTFDDGTIYFGEWKNNVIHGYGVYLGRNGEKLEGYFKNGKLIRREKTRFSDALTKKRGSGVSFLREIWNEVLTKNERIEVQKKLHRLGFYKSKIDGLYGRGTEKALKGYNKQNLKGINLEKAENAAELYKSILLQDIDDVITPENKNKRNSPKNYASKEKNKASKLDPLKLYRISQGTGFFVSSSGHVVTNAHVIKSCKKVKAFHQNISKEAQQLAIDTQNDLALLKIDVIPPYVMPISLEGPVLAQKIILAGFPFGDALSSNLKVTFGGVSSTTGLGNNYSQIQIDAAMQSGNSGGPIIGQRYGNVVGVAVSKLDHKAVLEKFGVLPENINFGIKSSTVLNFLKANSVPTIPPNSIEVSSEDIGRNAIKGTLLLTCWVTGAQVVELEGKRVMFSEFD